MKKKIFCFDLDNTLCRTRGNNYKKSKPYLIAIKRVNNLFDNGHKIKLFTARYMGRNNDKLIHKKKIYLQIKKQIDSWGLKYHKLFISKPSADIYIDDKGYGFNKSWILKFKDYEKKK